MAGLRKRDLQLLGVAAGAIAIFFVVRTAKRPRSQQPAAAPEKDTAPATIEDLAGPLEELGANTRSAIDGVLFKFQEFFKGERAPVDFT